MTPKTIAVEGQLSPFEKALADAGFRVIPLTDEALSQAQAIVVQGTDIHFLGMEDPMTLAPVINADGRTPADVVHEVERRLLRD
ncbi:MAG: YkuS family protein [Sulfobacillus sp.]|nr:YkuS family protein [Sulfobacillus sp.]